MFDISWSEFLLIGVVALIVIGPKELPGVLRTLGQWTRKIRSMANDFQNQFQEAMREAEMADLKKQVDDMAQDFTHFDPLKNVREDVESTGREFEKSIESPAPKVSEPAISAETSGDAALTATHGDAAELPAAKPEPVAAAPSGSTERSG